MHAYTLTHRPLPSQPLLHRHIMQELTEADLTEQELQDCLSHTHSFRDISVGLQELEAKKYINRYEV